jgi:general secretion pathway protein I
MTERRQAGFTLVEVLVSLAILALACGFAFRAFSGGLYWFGRDGNEEHAVLLAQTELARVGHDIPLQDGIAEGHAADGFSWRIAITPYGRPFAGVQGHLVAVAVDWDEGRQGWRVQIDTVRLGVAGGGA